LPSPSSLPRGCSDTCVIFPMRFAFGVITVGLAANNVLVYVDLAMFPEFDLSLPRSAVGAAGMVALVYGLVWETSR
jgi:hypothetical protein